MSSKEIINKIFKDAGIEINGSNEWDIKINNDKIYNDILKKGKIAFGEGYINKLWDCNRIDILVSKILKHDIESHLSKKDILKISANIGMKNILNMQSINRAKRDVPFHYDIGNDLYENMLDKRLTYTCAYWDGAENLDQAQEKKMDLICRKLDLKPGERLLDIGCGWASFINYAAENYGVICDGLTLSQEQMKLGKKIANEKGLDVNIILQDYREYKVDDKYDKVVSIGMIEHVGPENYDEFFKCVCELIKDDGLFLLHTISSPISVNKTDPWINKYIFPNGVIPSISQLSLALEGKMNIEDIHNFGPDYDKTLLSWCENFEKNWHKISDKYSDNFYRMWRYYLLSCAGAFRNRDLNLIQISLTKNGRALPKKARSS
ncbi:cyclopropane fatty acyl phospholipid synthase [Vibrio lentus]|uniref:Cyclopropane-fatty-acyl-phospholipid synthase n=1 Tax=Vibrio lentus TaxID=136468 RepID=A0A2N7BKT5_9VIBR|nr:cyclopropane fatty acyl phospholipid synthase [Vibrio lentus]PME48192.1 cyclopropane-fatty-acyl-phospholipid synthase [Vibrio lentus]PME58697.1 cyclopropane-fatty-acyl-phospholipid synthase [Vibrio lentus]PME94284.1 cyclopropane-fatty-acyl-phospholipid synthase [Vibrio lentus]